MQLCKFCGKFILTSYNQHLAIAHPKEWNKIKKEWIVLKNEGMTAQEIADKYGTNTTTVSKAIKDTYGAFHKLQRHKNPAIEILN